MHLRILGSAAGGGFPQWNCNYRLSQAVRGGENGFLARTQSSLAASANSRDWVVFNASPDIREQIAAMPALQPERDGPLRSSPIKAVVLTNADVDHIAGLLSLREREPFAIYAHQRVLDVLAANSIFNVLDPAIVKRRPFSPDGVTVICDAEDRPTGIVVEAFAIPGKVALFLEDQSSPETDYGSEEGDTIALRIEVPGDQAAFYIPGCARVDEALKARLKDAACLFFDGTVYTDDEMLTAGVGQKTGTRMGHMAMSGEAGSIAMLDDLNIGRRIFVHINNTNPVLDGKSAECAVVEAAGWEIGYDGMEVRL